MTYTTNLPNLQTCVTIFIILLFAYAAAWVVKMWIGE